MRILHLSPHPDDEILGAGGTLVHMARSGHDVINFACSLGRPEQQERRRKELTQSCLRAGFSLQVAEPPVAISATDNLALAEQELVALFRSAIESYKPHLVVAPSPHDNHHGHEVVGRAIIAAMESMPARSIPLWLWEFWSRLDVPTLLVPLEEADIQLAIHAVSAHQGENERADYSTMVRARAELAARAGFERVLGFGSAVDLSVNFAEELCEVMLIDGVWRFGERRLFTGAEFGTPTEAPATWLLHSQSVRSQIAAAHRC